MTKHFSQLALAGFLVLNASVSDLEAGVFPDAADSTFEYTAVKTGAWHDANTWSGTGIPGAGDDVRIPATCNGGPCRVTVQRQEPTGIRYLKVEGEFRLWIHSDSRLKVETIYVAPNATFRIGATFNPVKNGVTAEVVFTSSGAINTAWDPQQVTRGLISDGIIRFYGEPKTYMVTKSSDATKNATSISLDSVPGDWEVGDEIVLTGTHFDRYASISSSQDEVRTISGFTGNGVSFSPGLAYDHLRASSAMDLHVANLTRNLIFRSESTAQVRDRGHVMLRNGDVIIQNAAFIGLGRADKRVPLNDVVVTRLPAANPTTYQVVDSPTTPTNPRGRYSLHFHQNGANPSLPPPSTVHGCVVRDAIGWGFVNHSSHVDFQRNVAYDFVGAGFVTESGDELGNFFDNIAIRGTGDGSFDPIHRFVFNSLTRPQPLSDFGFRGDGFWFQGPAIRVRNNVANGCDSAGMVWFSTGAPIHNAYFTDTDGYQKNKYAHFERSWIDTVYGAGTAASINPRHWIRGTETGTHRIVISDLPILEMDGFESYGNYVGFRLRFSNTDSVAWFNDMTYDYHLKVKSTGAVNRRIQEVQNLKLWNNQQAFRMRYVDRTDWSNVTAINRLAYDATPSHTKAGHDGAEFYFALKSQRFLTPLVIEGYPVAGRIQHGSDDERLEVTFPGTRDYDGYANLDSWHSGLTCTKPSGLTVPSVGSTSATLQWSSGSPRHALRYRKTSSPQWTYVGPVTGGNSKMITGLSPSTAYEFQVVAGCLKPNSQGVNYDTLSVWSDKKPFSTP